MPITNILKTSPSGNHGGSQVQTVQLERQTLSEPRESATRFVSPYAPAVKKSPSIKEVMADPETPQVSSNIEDKSLAAASSAEQTVKVASLETTSQPVVEATQSVSASSEESSSIQEKADVENLSDTDSVENNDDEFVEYVEEESDDELFDGDLSEEGVNERSAVPEGPQDEYTMHWNTMLDLVFAKIPPVNSPLRDMPPEIVDNVMKIKVISPIQQKNIEQKRREMLEYFRNNYREDIDAIEVVVDEKVEIKKVIYDNHDKLSYMIGENRDMLDFMRILNLKLHQ